MKKHTVSLRNLWALFVVMACAIVAVVALTGCASKPKPPEVTGPPPPKYPFVQDAQAYAYINDENLIKIVANSYGLINQLFINNIRSVSLSHVRPGVDVAIVCLSDAINLSTIKRRQRLMVRMRFAPFDEQKHNWEADYNGTRFLFNIARADILLISTSTNLDFINTLSFIDSLPSAVQQLKVSDDYAFWGWADVKLFKNQFQAKEIANGYGALAIVEYTPSEDMHTDLALPYIGSMVDFVTLKLMLPFLFKSIGSDFLGSLPDMSFAGKMVTIRGLRLSYSVIKPFVTELLNTQKNPLSADDSLVDTP